MRTVRIENTHMPVAVTVADQVFTENARPQRRSIVFG
jgi:hypothetical protein